jgi:hypothetical protein
MSNEPQNETPLAPGAEISGVAKTIQVDMVIRGPDGKVKDHRIEARRDD